MRSFRIQWAIAGLAVSTSSFADVWVVDDDLGPGVDFVELQAAATSALEGDTLLVREGSYQGFQVQGKTLQVIADRDASVAIAGSISVFGLSSDQSVTIHGVDVQGDFGGNAFHALQCEGPVWVEDSTFRGADVPTALPVWHAAVIQACEAVSLNRCVFQGGVPTQPSGISGDGLQAVDSRIFAYDTRFEGGLFSANGGFGPAPGVRLAGGLLHANRGAILGGDGSSSIVPAGPCSDGGDGAPGLLLSGVDAVAILANTVLQGGAGGDAAAPCLPGSHGEPSIVLGGSLSEAFTYSRMFSANNPVRVGETLTLELDGIAGDVAFLAFSLDQAPQVLPSSGPVIPYFPGGVFLPDLPTAVVKTLGTVPLPGPLSVSIPAGSIGGLASLTLFAQAIVLEPTALPTVALGSAQSITVLDPSL